MRFVFRLAFPTLLGLGALLPILQACSSEGSGSFGPSYGDLPGYGSADAGKDGEVVEITDGATTDGPIPGCTTGSVAVVSGDNGRLIASVDRGRGFAVALLTGAQALSTPALTAYGDGFVALSRSNGNTLQTSIYGAAWSKPVAVGVAGIKGPPSLALDGTTLHVVYSTGPNDEHKYQRSFFDGTSWYNGEVVGSKVGSDFRPSFGTDSAGVAVSDGKLAFAENGGDNGLYTRTFDGVWSGSSPVFGAGTLGNVAATPQILPLPSGTYDMLMVFVKNDGNGTPAGRVAWVLRERATGKWVFKGALDPDLTTNDRVQLGRSATGDVFVLVRSSAAASNGKGFYFRGKVADDGVTFGVIAPIGGETAIVVDSTPSLAPGVCGDDAVLAFSSLGKVQIARLRGDAWTAPATIQGAEGYLVAVATRGQ